MSAESSAYYIAKLAAMDRAAASTWIAVADQVPPANKKILATNAAYSEHSYRSRLPMPRFTSEAAFYVAMTCFATLFAIILFDLDSVGAVLLLNIVAWAALFLWK